MGKEVVFDSSFDFQRNRATLDVCMCVYMAQYYVPLLEIKIPSPEPKNVDFDQILNKNTYKQKFQENRDNVFRQA